MATGLRCFTGRLTEDESSGQVALGADEGERLLHVQHDVSIVLGNRSPESSGTLCITSKQLVWINDKDKTRGYAVDFSSISLHAVSRDPDAHPSPCIYIQIETDDITDEEELAKYDVEDVGDPGISRITEMRLVPSDPSQLDTLFDILCEGAELNPELNHGFSSSPGSEGEHEWIFGSDEVADDAMEEEGDGDPASHNPSTPIGYANGDGILALNALALDDQRFADAEEGESVLCGASRHC